MHSVRSFLVPTETKIKISSLVAVVAVTIGIHYGWVLEPLIGPSHWIHAIHGRLCYIPIVIAASWFGLRGGLYTAIAISVLVMPFVFTTAASSPHELSGEVVEIVFYFAIAILAGWLVDRELRIRRKQEQTQLQLERSHKLSMVGRMAATVAHEIKNPLASIKGAVEIVCDEATPQSEKREFAGIIDREIKRIDRTIGEFLAYARPQETRLERLNLSEAVRRSLKQMESQAAKEGLRLISDIEDNLVIRGDGERIHQAVLNLLLNAIEASESGGTVEVGLTRDEAGGVALVVSDHGKGIDKSKQEAVFEPFYTTKPSGTGLGLAVVKAIVGNHHGTITLDSEPGQGTAVSIVFPAYREKQWP